MMNDGPNGRQKLRFIDGEADDIRDKISNLCTKFIHSVPFPLSDEQIWEVIDESIPEHVRGAYDVLHEYSDCSIQGYFHTDLRIEGDLNSSKVTPMYIIDIRQSRKIPAIGPRVLPCGSKHYPAVREWYMDALEKRRTCRQLQEYVIRALDRCNTPGQIRTVFPAMVCMLPGRYQSYLEDSKRATRWPVDYDKGEWAAINKEYENTFVLMKMVERVTAFEDRGMSVRLR